MPVNSGIIEGGDGGKGVNIEFNDDAKLLKLDGDNCLSPENCSNIFRIEKLGDCVMLASFDLS